MSRTKARAARRNRRMLLCAVLFVGLVTLLAFLIQSFGQKDPPVGGENTAQQSQSSSTDSVSDQNVYSTDTEGTLTRTSAAQGSTDTDTEASEVSTKTSTKTNQNVTDTDEPTNSFSKDEWYMILANRDNPLPEGHTFPRDTVYSAGQNWVMDARCADDMKQMIAAAKKDGVDLIICSSYRTVERQTNNFNNKVKEYVNKGYSQEEAKEIAATIIAIPGTSEHHTGLAADIVTPSYQRLNEGFAETKAFRWLYAHCAEYGFIMRYAEDKQAITKIIYEPWHYRYVGKEAAQIIMGEGICLEEFLEKYGT